MAGQPLRYADAIGERRLTLHEILDATDKQIGEQQKANLSVSAVDMLLSLQMTGIACVQLKFP